MRFGPSSVVERSISSVEERVFLGKVTALCVSPTRGSSFFLGKVTALGVLCCFALTLIASFFLLCHLSLKH